MRTEYLIAIDEFCASHNIEVSFINTLQQNGLIEVIMIRDARYIDPGKLEVLEKFVRLYYDLDINMEGIETITYLLQRIIAMQDEIISLRNRLNLYEPNE